MKVCAETVLLAHRGAKIEEYTPEEMADNSQREAVVKEMLRDRWAKDTLKQPGYKQFNFVDNRGIEWVALATNAGVEAVSLCHEPTAKSAQRNKRQILRAELRNSMPPDQDIENFMCNRDSPEELREQQLLDHRRRVFSRLPKEIEDDLQTGLLTAATEEIESLRSLIKLIQHFVAPKPIPSSFSIYKNARDHMQEICLKINQLPNKLCLAVYCSIFELQLPKETLDIFSRAPLYQYFALILAQLPDIDGAPREPELKKAASAYLYSSAALFNMTSNPQVLFDFDDIVGHHNQEALTALAPGACPHDLEPRFSALWREELSKKKIFLREKKLPTKNPDSTYAWINLLTSANLRLLSCEEMAYAQTYMADYALRTETAPNLQKIKFPNWLFMYFKDSCLPTQLVDQSTLMLTEVHRVSSKSLSKNKSSKQRVDLVERLRSAQEEALEMLKKFNEKAVVWKQAPYLVWNDKAICRLRQEIDFCCAQLCADLADHDLLRSSEETLQSSQTKKKKCRSKRKKNQSGTG